MKIEQRTVRQVEADEQVRNGMPVGPGVWVDKNGDFHVSIPDALKSLGLENNEENSQMAIDTLLEALHANGNCELVRLQKIDDKYES